MPKGGAREGAGRKKGVPNKVTADIKALAQSHGPVAIAKLVLIMEKTENDQAAIAAAKELLDRGYGKAKQQVEGPGENGAFIFQKIVRTIVDPAGDA